MFGTRCHTVTSCISGYSINQKIIDVCQEDVCIFEDGSVNRFSREVDYKGAIPCNAGLPRELLRQCRRGLRHWLPAPRSLCLLRRRPRRHPSGGSRWKSPEHLQEIGSRVEWGSPRPVLRRTGPAECPSSRPEMSTATRSSSSVVSGPNMIGLYKDLLHKWYVIPKSELV